MLFIEGISEKKLFWVLFDDDDQPTMWKNATWKEWKTTGCFVNVYCGNDWFCMKMWKCLPLMFRVWSWAHEVLPDWYFVVEKVFFTYVFINVSCDWLKFSSIPNCFQKLIWYSSWSMYSRNNLAWKQIFCNGKLLFIKGFSEKELFWVLFDDDNQPTMWKNATWKEWKTTGCF